MRHLSRFPILVVGLLMAAAACGRDAVVPTVSVPAIEVPVEEPVSVPVRITARETAPPEAG